MSPPKGPTLPVKWRRVTLPRRRMQGPSGRGRLAPARAARQMGGMDILCIGSVLWDIIGRAPRRMALGADVPGHITRLPGGVAMNIAMALARFGLRPALLTAIGQDAEGDELLSHAAVMGMETALVHRSERPTDRYMAIEGANGLIAAIADAHSLEAAGEAILAPLADGRLGTAEAPWAGPVALDGNLTEALLSTIAASPLFARADLRVAPASPGKAERLRPFLTHPGARLYVNLEEANILSGRLSATAAEAAQNLLSAGACHVLVTHGGETAACGLRGAGVFTARPPAVESRRVTGAGDTFMAAHIVMTRRGTPREVALPRALACAAAYVGGRDPVPEDLA
jgi:sugar/nucleoside kinase (ribokinase family)